MFVIVNVVTEKLYKRKGDFCSASYETERGARQVCTKLNKTTDAEHIVLPSDQYRVQFPVKMVQRHNMMSGLPYMEAEDTPSYCSPASEAYWSM